MKKTLRRVGGALTALIAGQLISAAAVIIPGNSDLWLAGMPDGSTASFGDQAPQQSPVEFLLGDVQGGAYIAFQASGSVNNNGAATEGANDGSASPDGLDDGTGLHSHLGGAENGLSGASAPMSALMGVFLRSTSPSGDAPPPALEWRDYIILEPVVNQVFFIGDGLSSDGIQQNVVVPVGATRLFLGTMDSFGWYNNGGAFQVTINPGLTPEPAPGHDNSLIDPGVTPVPEFSTAAAGLLALAVLGLETVRKVGLRRVRLNLRAD